MIISIKLTVFFSEPFWIGIFEEFNKKSYKVSKITFGQEPRDDEVYSFILKNFYKLSFTNEKKVDKKKIYKKENPKRIQRIIRKEIKEHGTSTKAQEALKEQYEKNKAIRKKISKKDKEKREKQIYEIKKQKRKEKHKGH